jgi:hypothetical protein
MIDSLILTPFVKLYIVQVFIDYLKFKLIDALKY